MLSRVALGANYIAGSAVNTTICGLLWSFFQKNLDTSVYGIKNNTYTIDYSLLIGMACGISNIAIHKLTSVLLSGKYNRSHSLADFTEACAWAMAQNYSYILMKKKLYNPIDIRKSLLLVSIISKLTKYIIIKVI